MGNETQSGEEIVDQRSPIQKGPASDGEADVFLKGSQQFLILRIEGYNPFPNIIARPEGLPELLPYFEALTEPNIGQKTAVSSPTNGVAPAADVASIKGRSPEALNAVISAEAKRLYAQLRTMTSSGDISLAHAHVVMLVFAIRAESLFAGNLPAFAAKPYLLNLARLLYDEFDLDVRR